VALEILQAAGDGTYDGARCDGGAGELVVDAAVTLYLPQFRRRIAQAAANEAVNPRRFIGFDVIAKAWRFTMLEDAHPGDGAVFKDGHEEFDAATVAIVGNRLKKDGYRASIE